MSIIRSVGYSLKDQDDDAAFQMLVTDVQRIKQELRMGSQSGAGGSDVGGVVEPPGLVDADLLKTYAISTVAPTDGQNLQYKTSTHLWTPTTPTAAASFYGFQSYGNGTSVASGGSSNQIFPASVIDTTAGAWGGTTFTAATAGYYFFSAQQNFDVLGTSTTVGIAILKNGSSVSGNNGNASGTATGTALHVSVDAVVSLAIADIVRISFAQTNNIASAGTPQGTCTMFKISST